MKHEVAETKAKWINLHKKFYQEICVFKEDICKNSDSYSKVYNNTSDFEESKISSLNCSMITCEVYKNSFTVNKSLSNEFKDQSTFEESIIYENTSSNSQEDIVERNELKYLFQEI